MTKASPVPKTTKVVELSPLDQTGPRLYVHKFFCFSFPDADRQLDAVEHLEKCLETTVQRWPFITGHVGPVPTTIPAEDLLELRYNLCITDEAKAQVLTVKNLSLFEFPWTYQDLKAKGMPPSAMDMDVLSTVPEWPQAGETYPALAIQANFVSGGLILCFAFHHAVADGCSFTTFVKEFAVGAHKYSRTNSIIEVDMVVPKRIDYIYASDEDDIRPLDSFPEYNDSSKPVRARSPAPVTTRILTFAATTVRKLELAVTDHLRKTVGAHAWASNIACLSSLVWVAVVRARQHRLDETDTAKIGVAVNIRSVMNPALPEDYFGNAILHTHASAQISDLLDGDDSANIGGVLSSISIATVALAAWKMRQAVQAVDHKYVEDRLKTLSNLDDPTEATRAYDHTMDNRNTGIDFSSWRDQGADIEFDIPGTATSTVDYWRKAWSPNEGAYNILPRKGGSKGLANWEISLGLSREDMEKVCSELELGAWVSSIVE